MIDYRVVGAFVEIHAGRVSLTPDQAKHRAAQLEWVGGNQYAVLETIQLKRGEVFGYNGEVGKMDLEKIAVVSADVPAVSVDVPAVSADVPVVSAPPRGRPRKRGN